MTIINFSCSGSADIKRTINMPVLLLISYGAIHNVVFGADEIVDTLEVAL